MLQVIGKQIKEFKVYTEYSFIIQCVLKGKSNKLGKTIELYDRPRYRIFNKKLP